MSSLKLITVNIEWERHLDTFERFLRTEDADVVCVQEITDRGIQVLKTCGYHVAFAPMTLRMIEGVLKAQCIAIAYRGSLSHEEIFYHKIEPHPPITKETGVDESVSYLVLCARIVHEGTEFVIGTTHFTWTPNGDRPSPAQISDMQALLKVAAPLEPHILCGDFNIPRLYSPLYNELLKHYTDNIPPQYATSIDKSMHRLRNDPTKHQMMDSFMVDYVFSTPVYRVTDVRLQFGVSDHAGVVATITRE